jgi:hypothetical protein
MQPNKADSVETIHMDIQLSFVPPIVRRKSKKKDKKRGKFPEPETRMPSLLEKVKPHDQFFKNLEIQDQADLKYFPEDEDEDDEAEIILGSPHFDGRLKSEEL